MTDALTSIWMLFIVFCPADDDCSIHYGRFPTETACHAALRELAQPVTPVGHKAIRQMVCTREVRS